MSRRLLCLMLVLPALVLSACGGDDDEGGSATPPAQPSAAKPADFPSVKAGASVGDITRGLGEGPILAPSVSEIDRGENRIAFALFDRSRKRLDVSEVAIYTANPDGSGAKGPFVARKESSSVDTRYRSRTTAGDLAEGDKFYVAEVPFSKSGPQVMVGLVKVDGRLVVSESGQPVNVATKQGPPRVGQKAVSIHTETDADVGGDLAKITTRVPPAPELLKTDFADVVGKKPVVLIFATPQLCASRVCGPVVDIAEQVRATSGKGVTFIQQEVYNDNDVNKGWRKQLTDWGLQTEPWTFVIDRRGRISSRLEGIYSTGELARAVAKVK